MVIMALSLTARAQNVNMGHHDMVHLTTNLLYDAALVPNVAPQYGLWRTFGFSVRPVSE